MRVVMVLGMQRPHGKVLGISLAVLVIALLPQAIAQGQTPSPVCIPGRGTPSVTEGPFYKSGSPPRASLLEPGTAGTKLVITGQVFSKSCRPVAGAWLDFWQ